MIPKEELKYRILKYVANNLKLNIPISVSKALAELGLNDYKEYVNDIIAELDSEDLVKTKQITVLEKHIWRLTLNGKYFIENYLKANSNLNELSNLIESTEHLSSVNTQLINAKKYLESNDNSDYRNAVKEAIGALESILQIALKKDKIDFSNAITSVVQKNNLHKAFGKGITALYGYNSNSGGVRHGLKEVDSIPDYTEAKFLVNIYASFVNYIAEIYNLT